MCWHKWKEYKQKITGMPGIFAPKSAQGKEYQSMEIRQKRICKKCGKIQDELIR